MKSLNLPFKATCIYNIKEGARKGITYELFEKKGWSLDIGSTLREFYYGIAKDILKKDFDLDVGIYLSHHYKDVFRSNPIFKPKFNVGMSISF